MADFNLDDFRIDPNQPLPPVANPPSRMLQDIDDVLESLSHVINTHSECEEEIERQMYVAFHRARALYVMLEETETNRLQRARELVAFTRECRNAKEIEI